MKNNVEKKELSYSITPKQEQKLKKAAKRKKTRKRVLTKLKRGTAFGLIFLFNGSLFALAGTKSDESTVDLTVEQTYEIKDGEYNLLTNTEVMKLDENVDNNGVVVEVKKTGEENKEYSFNIVDYPTNDDLNDEFLNPYEDITEEEMSIANFVNPASNEELQAVIDIENTIDDILSNEDTDTDITITLNYVKDDISVYSLSYGNVVIGVLSAAILSYGLYEILRKYAAIAGFVIKDSDGKVISKPDGFESFIHNYFGEELEKDKVRKR